MRRFDFFTRRGLRPLPTVLLAGALALPLAGCDTDELVAVEDPARLRPEDLTGIGSVPALVNGALRQFIGGYSGFGDDSFLSGSGLISDELYWGDTFTTRQAGDQRVVQPPVLGNLTDGAFARLQQARLNARRGYAVVEQFTTPQTSAADKQTQAQLRTIEGYVFVTLSEGWCGAVPISRLSDTGAIDPNAIEFGAPLGTLALNDTAVARFNEALALNSSDRLAAVGKARALLNLGRYADAAAAVASVPTTYAYRLEHSANVGSQNNPMFSLMANGRYGVSNLEGAATTTGAALRPDTSSAVTAASAEGLPFRGVRDPRIPYRARPNCFTSSIRCWINNNYPVEDADVPLASGVEARLIEAEAALAAGNPTLMMERLNTLRASVGSLVPILYSNLVQTFPAQGTPTLDPLTDPGTAAGRRDLLFRERAIWLYNTGHRQGDLRRLVRQYGLPQNQVFPSGPYFRGGSYGNDVAWPIPFGEQNNPEYAKAIEQCVTTQA